MICQCSRFSTPLIKAFTLFFSLPEICISLAGKSVLISSIFLWPQAATLLRAWLSSSGESLQKTTFSDSRSHVLILRSQQILRVGDELMPIHYAQVKVPLQVKGQLAARLDVVGEEPSSGLSSPFCWEHGSFVKYPRSAFLCLIFNIFHDFT